MKRFWNGLLVLGLLTGCSHDRAQSSAGKTGSASSAGVVDPAEVAEGKGAEREGKLAAPVRVRGEVDDHRAQLSLEFQAAASDVTVSVWGVRGLKVEGDGQLVKGRSFQKGEKLELRVPLVAPANRAELAVKVSGDFHGRKMTRVTGFVVGLDKPEAPRNAPGTLQEDANGEPVRVMKAH